MDVQESGSPFRVAGDPLIPILAILVVLWLLSQGKVTEFVGLGLLGVAITIAYVFRRKAVRPSGA
jgi:hypothetical protein